MVYLGRVLAGIAFVFAAVIELWPSLLTLPSVVGYFILIIVGAGYFLTPGRSRRTGGDISSGRVHSESKWFDHTIALIMLFLGIVNLFAYYSGGLDSNSIFQLFILSDNFVGNIALIVFGLLLTFFLSSSKSSRYY